MPKTVAPFYEPVPDYMRKLLLMGARFVEGNTNEGGDGGDGEQPPAGSNDDGADKDDAGKSKDDFKSKESKDAVLADLTKERADRKQAQADVAERDTQIQTLTESVAEKDTAITERDTQLAEKESEIAVLRLALTSGLHSQDDLDLLAAVTDEEKRKALADRLAKQSGVVRKSGTGDDDSNTGGSIAEYRRQIAERKQK